MGRQTVTGTVSVQALELIGGSGYDEFLRGVVLLDPRVNESNVATDS